MLYLRTGLPGSGKTLNTIREVERDFGPLPEPGWLDRWLIKRGWKKPFVQRELRTVYYYGIPDLDTSKLSAKWIEFDTPDAWYNLPDGSVIVIDEAQRIFGAQDGRKARPEKVARFETHRHQGFDIFLITQHPSLIMSHVRKLVGKHINMYRPFGGRRLHRYEYEFCIDAPEKRSNFKLGQLSRIRLDPKYYGVYRSATVHTHKFKLPNYVWLIPPLVLFIVGAGVYNWWLYVGRHKAEKPDQSVVQEQVSPGRDAAPGAVHPVGDPRNAQLNSRPSPAGADGVMTRQQYVDSYKPRIPNVPMSAPRYDQLTQPRSFPRLSCVMSHDPTLVEVAKRRHMTTAVVEGQEVFCQCYTQQSSRYDTTFSFCVSAVQNGYFDDTKPDMTAATPGVFNPDRADPTATRRVRAAGQLSGGAEHVSSANDVVPVTVVEDNEYPARPWRNSN